MVNEWSRRAKIDIRDLKAYIAKDLPYYARRFIERIIASVEKLGDFPDIGRLAPEAEGRKDVRELIYQGYRIIYLSQPDKLLIVTVIHGSRDLAGERISLGMRDRTAKPRETAAFGSKYHDYGMCPKLLGHLRHSPLVTPLSGVTSANFCKILLT